MSLLPVKAGEPGSIDYLFSNSNISIPNDTTDAQQLSSVLQQIQDSDSSFSKTIEEVVGSVTSVFTNKEIIEDANSPSPTGSSGAEVYANQNTYSPGEANPLSAEQQSQASLTGYTQYIQQSIFILNTFLKDVNQKEIELLENLFPGAGKTAYKPLTKEIKRGIKVSATASTALQQDYAQGNDLIKSNIQQYNTNQFRIDSASITSFNSPVLLETARQLIAQAEQYYISSDVFHLTTKNYWQRTEWAESYSSFKRNNYVLDHITTYSSNETSIIGGRYCYSDGIAHQIGNITHTPLHPARSNPHKFGKSYTRSLYGQYRTSMLGSLTDTALRSVNVNSVIGPVLINCITKLQKPATFPLAITQPKPMQDLPPYSKSDFRPWGQPSTSLNNNTPETNNIDQGASSGAYNTSYSYQILKEKDE